MRINEGKLGIIRFSTMVPVPKSSVKLLNISEQEEKYAMLLKQQAIFINLNSEKILHKAKSIYNSVTKNTNRFLVGISCDFLLLEKVYKDYKKIFQEKLVCFIDMRIKDYYCKHKGMVV